MASDATTALLPRPGGEESAAYAAANEVEDGSPPPSNNSATSVRRRYRHHVRTLVSVAVLVGLASGTLYGFGRYSLALKESLGVGQLRVQRFGILLDTGNYVGHPLTGYIYDHYGPKTSCLGAAVVVFCGYALIAAAVLNNGMMLLCDVGFFGVGFGSGLGYIAGLGSVTKAFLGKPTLGRAVAAVAAGYGLSSTLVGIAFHRIPSLHGFFLFWAVTVAVVNVIGAAVFEWEEEEEREIRDMADGYTMIDDASDHGNGNSDGNGLNASASTADEDLREQQFLNQRMPSTNSSRPRPWDAISTRWKQLSYRPWAFSTRLRSWKTWQRLDFWLLFGSFACVTGCGLFVINNVSTMVQSIGRSDTVAGDLVFLLSVCNVAGRIMMGALADVPSFHKVGLFQGAAVLMMIGLLVSAASPFREGDAGGLICLVITVSSVALAYGGSWVLIVGILADLYGRENFGKDYGLVAMGPALSGLVFNSASALVYEKRAEAGIGDDDDDEVCLGADCYRGSYWMTAAAAFVGSVILCRIPRTARSTSSRR